MYDDAHREKPERVKVSRDTSNRRAARAAALAALTPLVEAGRTFPTLAGIATAAECSSTRVQNWKCYPEAAALIQKLLAPSE